MNALNTRLLAAAHGASASTVLVSDVGVDTWGNVVSVAGHPNEFATGIIFNNDFLVFCVDLEHNIGVTHYNPALVFTTGLLEFDGAGNAISALTSNRIGRLADIGRALHTAGASSFDRVSAIQAAIWSLEYLNPFGATPTRATSANVAIDGYIADYLTLAQGFNGTRRAKVLNAHLPGVAGGVQNMTVGGVPEPATWALMIGGFGMAGVMLRRRRSAVAAA